MPRIGIHCSHEQIPPRELLRYLLAAEQAGFQGAMCSDHFHPWSEQQGQSGFAWSWLGAALQATAMSLGVVNAPGQRYHPAIIAQAAATLAQMYPDRFWIAVGTGQALNEHITGEAWPPKPQRRQRLTECVEIIRRLWAGETVSHEGLVRVRNAKLFTPPPRPPRLIGAAVSAETAAWVGSWADGLITIVKPADELQKVVQAFRENGGAGKPMLLQAQTCYAANDHDAKAMAFAEWGTNLLDNEILIEREMPSDLERDAKAVSLDDVEGHIRASSDLGQHIAWLEQDIAMGFDEIYVHQIGRNQGAFLEVFGERVLPTLQKLT